MPAELSTEEATTLMGAMYGIADWLDDRIASGYVGRKQLPGYKQAAEEIRTIAEHGEAALTLTAAQIDDIASRYWAGEPPE